MRLTILRPSSRASLNVSNRNCLFWAYARGIASPSKLRNQLDLPGIDKKWQKRWDLMPRGVKPSDQQLPKAYILPMFPYPSGALHMGHLRVYTISDVLARFKRMQGFDVLHPIGWDAFGLPAENAAIERGIDPAAWTKSNIAKMREQLQAMNASFDWDREFMTCDPKFYKHTQHIFLLLHKHGLAYQAESLVNYDPIDRTVLANEQVDNNGFSWRSGAKVEKIKLKQWFFRIKSFQDVLLKDLDKLKQENRWPERVVTMQRNWLGKSAGANIQFPIEYTSSAEGPLEYLKVYTTRPDTLFGVQFLALSLSHPIVNNLAVKHAELQLFVNEARSSQGLSKSGFLLPRISARNPLAFLPNSPAFVTKPIPIYVAPYVLDDYGEGAVMGVPSHDLRDFAFWKENGGSESAREVIIESSSERRNMSTEPQPGVLENVQIHPGVLSPMCGDFAGLTSSEAAERIVTDLVRAGHSAQWVEAWSLRDWLISRQRYWGTPIPIVHCEQCGAVPLPEDQLPIELPKLEKSSWLGTKANPLETAHEWLNTACPCCGGSAKRDTDTMDTFVDSSWYYMRFTDPHNQSQPFDSDATEAKLPVDIYVGGIEHAVLHLLYARFISKFLATTSLWPSGGGGDNNGEPFRKLITQGMVHGKTFSDPKTGRFLKPEELEIRDTAEPKVVKTGATATITWEKMSKSKYNGVDPTYCIERFGADVTRAHMLFQAPVSEVLNWEEGRIVGIQRWFNRTWRLVQDVSSRTPKSHLPNDTDTFVALPHVSSLSASEVKLWLSVQQTINSTTDSFSKSFSLNTVISDLTKLTNDIISFSSDATFSPTVLQHSCSAFLRMLAPVAPAFAEECWELLDPSGIDCDKSRNPRSIFAQEFPTLDGSLDAVQNKKERCAVQENGRLRFATHIARPHASLLDEPHKAELEKWVLTQLEASEEGKVWMTRIKERSWKRIVIAKGGRTVNFVG